MHSICDGDTLPSTTPNVMSTAPAQKSACTSVVTLSNTCDHTPLNASDQKPLVS